MNLRLHSVETVAGGWLWHVAFYTMKILNARFFMCVQKFL
jgi:hypothetical protein